MHFFILFFCLFFFFFLNTGKNQLFLCVCVCVFFSPAMNQLFFFSFFFFFTVYFTRCCGHDVMAISIKYFVSAWDYVSAVFSATCEVVISPNGGRSLAGGSCSSVRSEACCIWNGQVETDVLSRFS